MGQALEGKVEHRWRGVICQAYCSWRSESLPGLEINNIHVVGATSADSFPLRSKTIWTKEWSLQMNGPAARARTLTQYKKRCRFCVCVARVLRCSRQIIKRLHTKRGPPSNSARQICRQQTTAGALVTREGNRDKHYFNATWQLWHKTQSKLSVPRTFFYRGQATSNIILRHFICFSRWLDIAYTSARVDGSPYTAPRRREDRPNPHNRDRSKDPVASACASRS